MKKCPNKNKQLKSNKIILRITFGKSNEKIISSRNFNVTLHCKHNILIIIILLKQNKKWI